MLRYLSISVLIALLTSLPSADLDAQYRSRHKKVKHRFNAGLVLGFGLSQIDGDQYTGFDKVGLRGGLKGSIYIHPRLDIVVGLLYNQKGSRFEDKSSTLYHRNRGRVLHFDYMEVPLMISFKMEKDKEAGYILETGFSYARLVNTRIEEVIQDPNQHVSFAAIVPAFNSNEFNYIASLNYFFNRHIGLGVVYTIQLNETYHNILLDNQGPRSSASAFRTDPTLKIPYLRNYQLSFQLVYNIF